VAVNPLNAGRTDVSIALEAFLLVAKEPEGGFERQCQLSATDKNG
jgi:hypothetical protein